MKQDRVAFLSVLTLLLSSSPALFAGTHHLIRFIRPGQISGSALETMHFSPDGSILAVATTDGKVSFINPESGEKVGEFKHQPFSMDFSRDGSRLLMIARNETQLLDMQAGIPTDIDDAQEQGVVGISINIQNGKLVITSVFAGSPAEKSGNISVGDELVEVGAGKAGRFQKVIGASVNRTLELLRGRPGEFVRLKTVPKGTIEDRVVLLRRAAIRNRGNVTQFVPFEEVVIDENLVWCISNDSQAFYHARTGKLISSFRLEEIDNRRGWHAISPDNKHCAFLGRRLKPHDKEFAIEVYDIGRRERIAFHTNIESRNASTFVAVSAFWGFHYSPDGKYLLAGTWGGIQVVSAESGKELHQIDVREGATEFAKPGEKLTNGDRIAEFSLSSRDLLAVGVGLATVRLFDFKNGKFLHTLPQREDDNKVITGVEFSPNGKWLAYYNNDRLHLVDVEEFYPQPEGDEGNSAESLDTARVGE